MRKLGILSIPLAIWALTACSGNLLTVHKIDIQQGNALKQKSIRQLKIGMQAEQVSFLLGHPMVNDLFHQDRWYYVYYFKPGSGQLEERRLTVHFNEGRVTRIETPQPTKLASGSESGA
jgi:outer membrane protein assembly factor BamE